MRQSCNSHATVTTILDLATLGGMTYNRNDSICVVPPKVANAITVVTVVRYCHHKAETVMEVSHIYKRTSLLRNCIIKVKDPLGTLTKKKGLVYLKVEPKKPFFIVSLPITWLKHGGQRY
jgi:hypothetical protein